MKFEIAPSILAADFSRLAEHVQQVAPFSGRIHADVMDGHFVPNLSMGPALVASLRGSIELPIEVHLMVTNPEHFVDPFVRAGADRLIFHLEVAEDPKELARRIAAQGVSAGIAINPDTPWQKVEKYLPEIDLVVVMTVNPGFGGQPFMREVLGKVSEARKAVSKYQLDVDIEVDGGIDSTTAKEALDAGANIFVAGQAIFGQPDPARAGEELMKVVQGGLLGG
ncbi:MAG: ribulose-phosphate 3-epimerase [Actinomycetota bacterium]